MSRLAALALAALAAVNAAAAAPDAAAPDERFRQANASAGAGDLPAALAGYRALAAAGDEYVSLYWNWAQAAGARGALGETLWALLRARELAPGDAAISREIDRVRELAGLDPAEVAPRPLAALARTARRLHLGLSAVVLLALSLAAHASARVRPAARWPVPLAWAALGLGLALAAVPLLAARSAPLAVVVERDARLTDAASPDATALVTLREGEVVPVLAASGGWLRVEDSSGARGWVAASAVWRLDRPPAASR